jgi:hypothetical protein
MAEALEDEIDRPARLEGGRLPTRADTRQAAKEPSMKRPR